MSNHHEYGSFPKSFKIKGTLCSSVKRPAHLTLLKCRKGFYNSFFSSQMIRCWRHSDVNARNIFIWWSEKCFVTSRMSWILEPLISCVQNSLFPFCWRHKEISILYCMKLYEIHKENYHICKHLLMMTRGPERWSDEKSFVGGLWACWPDAKPPATRLLQQKNTVHTATATTVKIKIPRFGLFR